VNSPPVTRSIFIDPSRKLFAARVAKCPDGPCQAAAVVQIVFNGNPLLLIRITLFGAYITCRQVVAACEFAMPMLQGIRQDDRWFAFKP